MSKRSEFIKKCMDDPKSVTQEELQDNYEADIKKYYVAREDRLYKLSQGSDTAVWAHDEIIKQDKRIAELERRWISVEDRLPDSDLQNVLAFCDGGNIQTTRFHSDRFAFKRLGWPKSNCYTRKLLGKLSGHFMLSHDSGYKVTHWMPLPEPPKEQGE
jgi:hypothetical protein